MKSDKPSWYDGNFYERIIRPWLKEVRNVIFEMVDENSTVLDIGCGPGDLVFKLSGKCKKVVGVDKSDKMINSAKSRKKKLKIKNVEFFNEDIFDFLKENKGKFDYAIFSLSLHEMPMDFRIKILKAVKKSAKKIIIADINVPRPWNSMKVILYVAEFFAGREHFKGYKDFVSTGGIENLLTYANLSKEKEELALRKVYKIVVANK